jgi:hypothetical protein
MNQQIGQIMKKEVTRKEFLGMSGLAIASVFGFSTIIKLLTGKSLHSTVFTNGYGSTAYGGNKEGSKA